MLWPMAILAFLGLVLSVLVHLSSVFGVDVQAGYPWVWALHILIFPPFAAAIIYTNRATGDDRKGQALVISSAPRWLGVLTGVFFVYAFVNFILFMSLDEGIVSEEAGGYVLRIHGDIVRVITEAEYHAARAWETRGFSGHWMLFYSVSLLMLVGAYRVRRGVVKTVPVKDPQDLEVIQIAEKQPDVAWLKKPVPGWSAAGALLVILTASVLLVQGKPYLSVFAPVVLLPFAYKHWNRMRARDNQAFESVLGCLVLVPVFFMTVKMVGAVATALCVAVSIGWFEGFSGAVDFARGDGTMRFSNGDPLRYYWVFNLSTIFLFFTLTPVCLFGYIYLADTIARWIGQDRKRRNVVRSPYRIDET